MNEKPTTYKVIIAFLCLVLISCSGMRINSSSPNQQDMYGIQESALSEQMDSSLRDDQMKNESNLLPAVSEGNAALSSEEDLKIVSGVKLAETAEKRKQESTDDALELISQSQDLWEKGDLDSALSLLDQAYAIVIELNGDSDFSWQKDDLRFIISKRILEIYTARSSVATGSKSEIPLNMNADIQKEISCFQNYDRRFFLSSYERAAKYYPVISAYLKEAGLPEELVWLPLVESGFKVQALSRARALGLWQFIPSTGYKYGLKRDHWVDERMDVEKSTKAAIAYLKELHGIFGDWLTVLAAYNCGEGRVLRVISRQHMNYLDNFWDLYRQLPSETSRYVPRFLAAVHIIKNPGKYGMNLKPLSPVDSVSYELFTTSKCMRLSDIGRALGVSEEQLIFLNSELRFKMTPDKDYALRIPTGLASDLALLMDDIKKAKVPGVTEYVYHHIRQGDTLSSIAEKYGTSVESIARINNINSRHRIRAGKSLKIPLRGYTCKEPERTKNQVRHVKNTLRKSNYAVQKGDSLWLLARRFGTTVSEIKSLNRLKTNDLQIGQQLIIGNEDYSRQDIKSYTIEKGDCLYTIARKNNVSLDELIQLNRLSEDTVLYPGQAILVRQ